MFYENLEQACKAKGTSITAVLKKLGKGTANGTYWKNGSIPNGEMLIQLSELLDVSTDYLLALDSIPNRNADSAMAKVNGTKATTPHDVALCYIRYRIGWEDAEFMFQAADIPIDDSQYEMPDKVLRWMAAHCGFSAICFNLGSVGLTELVYGPYYNYPSEGLDELLKDPEIEKMENRYLKLKYDKYTKIAEDKHLELEGVYQTEIRQGFADVIDKFKGDLGSQFVLLDRCRQCAAQLAEDNRMWKEEGETLKKEGA